jgi:hypothetical protein
LQTGHFNNENPTILIAMPLIGLRYSSSVIAFSTIPKTCPHFEQLKGLLDSLPYAGRGSVI